MLAEKLSQLDVIFPALEDYSALKVLHSLEHQISAPIVFDLAAYEVTRSKKNSRKFFARHGLPHALSWPRAEFPVIVKPVEGSGSQEVYQADDISQLNQLRDQFSRRNEDYIIEEFLQGEVYSLEVIADGDKVYKFLPTKLKFDEDYDCSQVLAGKIIKEEKRKKLESLAENCAYELNLRGIMDIEVIDSRKGLKIMEIDARFPSQTPITVYEAADINMVKILAEVFRENPGKITERIYQARRNERSDFRAVIYEQIRVEKDRLEIVGEHVISGSKNLHLCRDFFGAEKALTNYCPGRSNWQAVLIFAGDNMSSVKAKRRITYDTIEKVIK